MRPAFRVFLELQKRPGAPAAVILQPDHSKLAGEIAKALRPEVFGDLPEPVMRAVAEHDFGWRASDEAQLAAIRQHPPRPFPLLSAAESLPAWRESVRRAERESPLEGVVVSRHFCALAAQDPPHRPFADEENPRREAIEKSLGVAPADLDRFTGAIGFCDLVSLYLCSGAREPAEFPLGHPALPQSRNARKVFLEWSGEQPRFSSPLLAEGATVLLRAIHPDAGGAPSPFTIEWRFIH